MAIKTSQEIETYLESVVSKKTSAPAKADFTPPPKLKKDAETFDSQKLKHRKFLLFLIAGLSIASFLLLAFVVIVQMFYRMSHSTYTGVSDTVMNVLAVSVFGQVIAVVATIVRSVWKDPK